MAARTEGGRSESLQACEKEGGRLPQPIDGVCVLNLAALVSETVNNG